jgi:transposase
LDSLKEGAQGELRHLDATHIKVHQDAANPAEGQEKQAFGHTKGGLNTKLTALVDSQGHAVELTLAPGNKNDVVAAQDLVLPQGKRVVADKGYDSDRFRGMVEKAGSKHCIPPRARRKTPASYHKGHYRRRHRVRNFFQRIKRYRRTGTRYDKLDLNFVAFIQLAAVLDWLL